MIPLNLCYTIIYEIVSISTYFTNSNDNVLMIVIWIVNWNHEPTIHAYDWMKYVLVLNVLPWFLHK